MINPPACGGGILKKLLNDFKKNDTFFLSGRSNIRKHKIKRKALTDGRLKINSGLFLNGTLLTAEIEENRNEGDLTGKTCEAS